MRGLIAGLLAACVLTLVMLGLRVGAGVPLTFELGADRVLPTLEVQTFLGLLRDLGGAIQAKRLAFLGTLAGQVLAGGLLGLVYAAILRRGRSGARFVLAVVLVLWLATLAFLWPTLGANFRGVPEGPATALTALTLLAALAGFGASLMAFHRMLTPASAHREPPPAQASAPATGRRQFVVAALGGGAALASGGLTKLLGDGSALAYDGMGTALNFDAITPNDRFYCVTKNIIDPRIAKSLWRLRIAGEVDRAHTYDYDELAALDPVEREITLECISNGIGSRLISNAMWTGVPLRTLLERAGVKANARWLSLHGCDGYTHSLGLERAMNGETLVAHSMNGVPLPHRHGYPVRLLVPGNYGEVSVKWIDRIDVLDDREDGYYERQGWKADVVHTISRINLPRELQVLPSQKTLQISGMAFAGDRGISAVEVSTDGGRLWHRASIDYRRAKTAWVLWHYAWAPAQARRVPPAGAGDRRSGRAADRAPSADVASRRHGHPRGEGHGARVTIGARRADPERAAP